MKLFLKKESLIEQIKSNTLYMIIIKEYNYTKQIKQATKEIIIIIKERVSI